MTGMAEEVASRYAGARLAAAQPAFCASSAFAWNSQHCWRSARYEERTATVAGTRREDAWFPLLYYRCTACTASTTPC